jgi:L-malate glycosyltransferase
MKICHVIYIPRLSGAEILVRDLAIAHSSMGHNVTICSIEPPENSFEPILNVLQNKQVILAFPERQLSKISRLSFLIKSLKRLSPDVVVAHSIIPSAYVRLALHLASIPVVTVLHDASQDDYAAFYFRNVEKVIKPSSYVIPLTDKALSNYRMRCGEKSKAKIIPNGVDLSKIQLSIEQRENFRKMILNVSQTESAFLQVGRFNRQKQQHLSIKAFIQAYQDVNFNGKLFLAGIIEDEKYFSELQKMVTYSNLQDKVVFLGPRSDIPALLSASDVYLMPSLTEAHSISFLEALVDGITMIVSDISAFEKGKKFEGVMTLDVNDVQKVSQIIVGLSNRVLQTRYHRDTSEFSIATTADAYLEVFDSLIS